MEASLQSSQLPLKERHGVLLLNLGTPDGPEPHQVRKYLKQFLMDPFVIDIPYPLRWFLVNLLILPKRSFSSSELYRKIWGERGSPLLFHLKDLAQGVQQTLGGRGIVKFAMRYGSPSIPSVLAEFQDAQIRHLTVVPLYPQYSLAATQSSIEECLKHARKLFPEIQLKFVPPFYKHPLFIESFSKVIQTSLQDFPYDHLLFSFHGLPERHVKATDPTGNHCLSSEGCCEVETSANQNCYRAQCYTSARLMAQTLGIAKERYSVCFQSRLGRTPWIKPYTDEFYRELPKRGIRRLAVVCPAFVADCLETLEEVRLRGRDEFIRSGGEELKLVESLNATEPWVKAVAHLTQTQA